MWVWPAAGVRATMAPLLALLLGLGLRGTLCAAYSPGVPVGGFVSLPFGTSRVNVQAAVSGTVPSWLSGTLYRNGPANYENMTTSHWFDGLAMVHSFAFTANSQEVTYNGQFVQSTEYLNRFGPGNGSVTSPNTCVTMKVIDESLVLTTGTMDGISVDPVTLETVEAPFQYNDTMGSGGAAPSHGHVDLDDGSFWHFEVVFSFPNSSYVIYKVPKGTRTRIPVSQVPSNPSAPLGLPFYSHSFSITKKYFILAEAPCSYGIPGEYGPAWWSFGWYPSLPTLWHIVDRSSGEEVATFQSEAFFSFHHINAFEDPDSGDVVVDLVPYANIDILSALYVNNILNNQPDIVQIQRTGVPTRYVLPVGTAPNGTLITGKPLSTNCMELPTINYMLHNGRPYRFVYGYHTMSNDSVFFSDSLVKIDASGTEPDAIWHEPNLFPGEPVFVPRPGAQAEDDGVVMSVVFDNVAQQSFLLILDGQSFTEVARATLTGLTVPFGFHGMFFTDLEDGWVSHHSPLA